MIPVYRTWMPTELGSRVDCIPKAPDLHAWAGNMVHDAVTFVAFLIDKVLTGHCQHTLRKGMGNLMTSTGA
jgi:hypothetical protein